MPSRQATISTISIAAVALLAFFAVAGNLSAQSGSKLPGANPEKANKRPEAPKPTPTPDAGNIASADAGPVDGPEIVVETRLVTVPVRAMDKNGRFISGLQKSDFKVFEDGAEQEITLFSNESQPFTVALVLDMSYSAKFKAAEIQQAALQFIEQLRPADRVAVIAFDDDVQVLCGVTADREVIKRAIRSTKIDTGTSLYEAVDAAVNQILRPIEGRKALVLFTDGVDTTSKRKTELDNLRDIAELDTLIYPIRYDTFEDVQRIKNTPQQLPTIGLPPTGGPPPGSTPPTLPQKGIGFPIPVTGIGRPDDKGTTRAEYDRGEQYLIALAEKTGGRVFVADSLANLSNAFAKIASELREYYSISYYPKSDDRPGRVRKIKVRTERPGIALKYRDSYAIGNSRKKS